MFVFYFVVFVVFGGGNWDVMFSKGVLFGAVGLFGIYIRK